VNDVEKFQNVTTQKSKNNVNLSKFICWIDNYGQNIGLGREGGVGGFEWC